IKNRLVRSGTWLAGCADGEITDELISRYVELAEGGCSLIVTGFAFVSPEGAMAPGMIGVEDDSRLESLRKLTEAVHAADGDAKIFCQPVHTGIFRLPMVRTTYADTFAADETADPFVEMGGTGETCPAASEEQIRKVIEDWAAAAVRCKEAGFDGIELHYGHAFGPGAWFSPLWNHRSDDWGGNVENRSRYGVEVLKAVREAVGDWPVTAKLNCEDGLEGGVTTDDVVFFAQKLAEAGVDALVISGGSPASPPKLAPSRLARAGTEGENGEGYFADATAKVCSAVGGDGNGGVKVIGVGGWRTPAIMEKHAGVTCDAFAISRPTLENPAIVNRWMDDPAYLTGCISCNKCSGKIEGLIICRRDEK
ncbi:NADH:flavin oxidoreductase, partial [bacterium]|nr:NADH:flavin oxidoreductase [bacterium]